MFARLGQVLCGIALVSSDPAYAAEVWDCTYTSAPVPLSGRIEIQIDGKALDMQNTPDNAAPDERDRRRYEVLENNDAATVAVKSMVMMVPPRLGPSLIGAAIIM